MKQKYHNPLHLTETDKKPRNLISYQHFSYLVVFILKTALLEREKTWEWAGGTAFEMPSFDLRECWKNAIWELLLLYLWNGLPSSCHYYYFTNRDFLLHANLNHRCKWKQGNEKSEAITNRNLDHRHHRNNPRLFFRNWLLAFFSTPNFILK